MSLSHVLSCSHGQGSVSRLLSPDDTNGWQVAEPACCELQFASATVVENVLLQGVGADVLVLVEAAETPQGPWRALVPLTLLSGAQPTRFVTAVSKPLRGVALSALRVTLTPAEARTGPFGLRCLRANVSRDRAIATASGARGAIDQLLSPPRAQSLSHAPVVGKLSPFQGPPADAATPLPAAAPRPAASPLATESHSTPLSAATPSSFAPRSASPSPSSAEAARDTSVPYVSKRRGLDDQADSHTPQSGLKRPTIRPDVDPAATPAPHLGSGRSRGSVLRGVKFVISGVQNPRRHELRQCAVAMGAQYSPNWEPGCTHLIAAFGNTPKHKEVLASGHGMCVLPEWVDACHRACARVAEADFSLGAAASPDAALVRADTFPTLPAERDDDIIDVVDEPPRSVPRGALVLPDVFAGTNVYFFNVPDWDPSYRLAVAYGASVSRVFDAARVTHIVVDDLTAKAWLDWAAAHTPPCTAVPVAWVEQCARAGRII